MRTSPNKLAARIFGAVGCSRLRAERASWSDRGAGVDPTHPLTLALTLTLTLTLTSTRTQNGPEMGEKCGCGAYGNVSYTNIKNSLHSCQVLSPSETGFIVSAHRLTKITLLTLIATL